MEKRVEYKTETMEKSAIDIVVENTIKFLDNQGNEISLNSNATRRQYAPNATDQEWEQFKDTIEANGLDPRRKEVYFQKYTSKEGKTTVSIVTSYLVYSARAFKSGKIKSISAPKVIKPSENMDSWLGEIEIERTDIDGKITWQTPMREVNKHQSIWNVMPEFMLKKNTFAQGLRFYLPDVIGGLPYLQEEITSGVSESDITSNDIPEDQIIEPSDEELKAKEQAKNDFLEKLMIDLTAIGTIAELEKKYKANKKAYESSEMKDSILKMYASRKHQLTIEDISLKTGHSLLMVQTYLDDSKDDYKAWVEEALVGNPDGVEMLKERIDSYIKNTQSHEPDQEELERESAFEGLENE